MHTRKLRTCYLYPPFSIYDLRLTIHELRTYHFSLTPKEKSSSENLEPAISIHLFLFTIYDSRFTTHVHIETNPPAISIRASRAHITQTVARLRLPKAIIHPPEMII
jgi:hypothetical protein